MLIDTARLSEHLEEPDWIVFDCRHDLNDYARGEQIYCAEHIPGAFFARVETDLSGPKSRTNGRHPLPDPHVFAEFLGGHGVTENTHIVAYDDVGGQYAARLWWMARWIGLTRVAVLDGGLPKWKAEQRALSAEMPTERSPQGLMVFPDDSMWLSVEAVEANIQEGQYLILDARAPERYLGKVEPLDKVAGHIPGAANHFFQSNLAADLTMRPAAELRAAFERVLDGRAPNEVVHQCGSGITACANLLAMEYVGLTGSRLYPGSWSEWIADPRRPIAAENR